MISLISNPTPCFPSPHNTHCLPSMFAATVRRNALIIGNLSGKGNPVGLALGKHWKAYKPTNGQVTQHLAPTEQQVLMPWVREWPKRLKDKFFHSGPEFMPSILCIAGIGIWLEGIEADITFHHRE